MPPPKPKSSGVGHELRILATVLGTAVVLGVIVSVLPGIGRPQPEADLAAGQYVKAQAAEKTDLDRALELYSAIPRESGEWYDRAQAQIARLRAEIARRPPKPTAAEQAAYDELLEFWRQNAGKHDELIRKGETFVATFPRGELRPAVEERIAHARQARLARRTEEAAEVEAAVTRCVERHDFAGAIQAIEKASPRLRGELDVWPRLAARRDAVVAEGRRHYQKQVEESNRMVKEGRRDDARRLWYSVMRAFGDGKIPELADLHRAAALRAEEIRP
jgi:hypothetical protein